MSMQMDAIVIGAGIAGTSSALQLARAGHRTLLLDRQQFPRHKTCGEFMSPETREMLEYLDIYLLDNEVKPSTMDHAKIIMPSGGEIAAPLPGPAYGISRFELDRLLHEQATAAGVQIATRTAVTDIKQLGDQSYEVITQQQGKPVHYRAKAVIGAYGTKKPRGIPYTQEERDDTVYVGVKSHFQGIMVPSRVELYFCDGGYVGISPIEDGKVNVAALLALDVVQGSGKSVPDILEAATRSNMSLRKRMEAGTPVPGTQVSIAPLRLSDTPNPWSDYPHIGDAMMMLPPLCGDGMSIALRSSLLCSHWTDRYLLGEIGYTEWQEGYSNAANQTFTQLLKRARRIQKLAFAKTNRFYPGIARVIPGLASYVIKSTRLSESGSLTR
ncbi:NAD(P)/FAD-dependent oxidoreductase [Paenibacillus sp. JCM 10914]|uniref:NAD(P)/FAD-dependent oxidoreductase n=1 Tax=Paenibacillus sp. JCM 10914 TaxID=1236974 RepID=UPI0003CC94A5|nr:FAD-dependent oxidoreductase [Paenibacillus sp. JCM 10914]GAE07458.1 long-chain-fatty-acid-CoA ligase [Paenibacillus sp. JCM 10914]